MPFWELASKLEVLSFWTGEDAYFLNEAMEEQDDPSFASFEAHGEPVCCFGVGEEAEINHAIAVRTIIAAAKEVT